MSRSLMIINFVLFQIGWFACVLGGAHNLPLVGSVVALAVIAVNVWLSPLKRPELNLVWIALAMGLIFESLLAFAGITHYSYGILIDDFAPYWMVIMWGLFATTVNVSMRWLKALPLWAVAALGAVLAPLSYWAGNRLGAVEFSDFTTAMVSIAIGWAVLLPLLTVLSKRFDGYADQAPTIAPHDKEYANV